MTEERIKELEDYASMLGRIAQITQEFCEDEEDTTLQAVANLLALYREYQAKEAWDLVNALSREK